MTTGMPQCAPWGSSKRVTAMAGENTCFNACYLTKSQRCACTWTSCLLGLLVLLAAAGGSLVLVALLGEVDELAVEPIDPLFFQDGDEWDDETSRRLDLLASVNESDPRSLLDTLLTAGHLVTAISSPWVTILQNPSKDLLPNSSSSSSTLLMRVQGRLDLNDSLPYALVVQTEDGGPEGSKLVYAMLEALEQTLAAGNASTEDSPINRTFYICFGADCHVALCRAIRGQEGPATCLQQEAAELGFVVIQGSPAMEGVLGLDRPVLALGVQERSQVTVRLRTSSNTSGNAVQKLLHEATQVLARVGEDRSFPDPGTLEAATVAWLAPHAGNPFHRIVLGNAWLFSPLGLTPAILLGHKLTASTIKTMSRLVRVQQDDHSGRSASGTVVLSLHPADTVGQVLDLLQEGMGTGERDRSGILVMENLELSEAVPVSSVGVLEDLRKDLDIVEGYRVVARSAVEAFPGAVLVPATFWGGRPYFPHYARLARTVIRFTPYLTSGDPEASLPDIRTSQDMLRAVAFYRRIMKNADLIPSSEVNLESTWPTGSNRSAYLSKGDVELLLTDED